MDHAEGLLRVWDQLQREFFNEFRQEVGQNMALRALINVRQGTEEKIYAYIRSFDMVCARYVRTLLNDDTLKQFFIQGFIKSSIIRGVLDRNPYTLAGAKVAARKIEHIYRNYERLWRKNDELIPNSSFFNQRLRWSRLGRLPKLHMCQLSQVHFHWR